MTEFDLKLRHYCRFDRCKLHAPTSNLHEAFCSPGCYRSFHLKRCGVCEKTLEQRYRKLRRGDTTKYAKLENRGSTCGSPECRRRWREGDGLGRFWPGRHQGSQKDVLAPEVPANGPLSEPIQKPPAAKRVQIAGPALTPNQLHCATIPDGPNCEWEGGELANLKPQAWRSICGWIFMSKPVA